MKSIVILTVAMSIIACSPTDKTQNSAEEIVSGFDYAEEDVNVVDGDLEVHNIDQQNSNEPSPVDCGTTVYDGNPMLTEQRHLEQFVREYGTVRGTVTIEGKDIVDATGLDCLTTVSLVVSNTSINELTTAVQESLQVLHIRDNPNLENVLIPVQKIGSLHIRDNPQLIDIDAQHTIGQTLNIEENSSLETITVSLLQENSMDFSVQDNPNLHFIQANSVQYVGGSVMVEGNTTLAELSFGDLEMTGGSITIQENETLHRLALPNLYVVGDLSHSEAASASLNIVQNAGLRMTSFPELFYVSGDLNISNNARLETLDGFDTLTSVGDLIISGNTALRSVLELSTLTEVVRMNISFNPTLSDAMVRYLYEVEIGDNAVEGNVQFAGNRKVSSDTYHSSSCSADYTAVHSGDFYPEGSVIFMSSAKDQCSVNEFFMDGTVWEISSDCICIE
jgi:hypothetical protein